jgi:D-sedoheptulose 7-phosphate isomerase
MANDITDIGSYFDQLSSTVKQLPFDTIEAVAEALLKAFERDHTIFIFGNGGSAALASHFACDLNKGTVNGSEKRFKVMALTDNVPLITAWANDRSYDQIFSQQISNFIRPGDVALGISGSGNSLNVLNALRSARQAKAITIGLTGFFHGGKMKSLCDLCMVVPSDNLQIVEDLHLCTTHALFTSVRRKLERYSTAFA